MHTQVIDQGELHNDGGVISAKAFAGFQGLIYKTAGISMSEAKKSLVSGRLAKRLRALNFKSYDEYLEYITKGEGAGNGELQIFIDLLTTNETYFFREPQHFDFLKKEILARHEPGKLLRIWSAASSSGEEAYTLAIILSETLGINANWEIVGTDISTEMIKAARQGIYNEHRVRLVEKDMRHKYMLRGTGDYHGFVAIAPEIKKHVTFEHYNLVESPPRKEIFDVIFCRNVLIYFSQETKILVLERLCKHLKTGSYLMTGHSESLHGMLPQLLAVKPSVYLKKDLHGKMTL